MEQANMVAKPTKLPSGQIVWNYGFKGGELKGPGQYPAVDTTHGKACKFTIEIDNPPGVDIHFDPQDPIWVKQDGCPRSSGIDNQIKVQSASTTKLHFTDRNVNPPTTLHYRLNFVDGATGRAVEPLDPEIRNKGGGTGTISSFSTSTGTILTIGAAVAAVVAVVAIAWPKG